MRGAEGRLAVLVEVTLRLVPAPWTAWAEVPLPGGRLALLAALSAARAALTPGLIDSALLDDDGREGGRRWLRLRARSERDEDDLTGVIDRVEAMLAQHALAATGWQAEGGAARTGQRPLQRPWQELAGRLDGDLLDLRLSWPDAPKVLDVVDALAAGGKRPVRRLWSFGQDGARLRLLLPTGASARHPLRAGAQHLLDAGAVPVRAEGALRELLRERMPSAAKVLLAALARVWDPDDLLVTDVGPF
jgi:hypothetical protein